MARQVWVLAVLLALAGGVQAASVSELGSDGKINGASGMELPAAVGPGDTIEGPATVTANDGSVLNLSAGALLKVLPVDGDKESFFLSRGFLRGSLSSLVEVALTVGWVAGPKAGSAEVFLESLTPNSSYLEVQGGGRALVAQSLYHFFLDPGKAVELTRVPGQQDAVDFATRPTNEGKVRQVARVSVPLEIWLASPEATMVRIEQIDNGARTRVTTDPGSQGGSMDILTMLNGVQNQSGELGPGTFAIIDNITGEITFGFEDVDYAMIVRTISLTSEFAVLALSNFAFSSGSSSSKR